jgi:hypothetical protein
VSKATSWLGQAARPFRGSRRSPTELSFHGLMCPASSILLATPGDGFKPQKTHRRPQLVSTFNANTCCPTRAAARMIPFGISLWPVTLGGATGNLIPQGALEYRRVKPVLAEEGKLAGVLEVEEIRQAVAADAFSASGTQQQRVDSRGLETLARQS